MTTTQKTLTANISTSSNINKKSKKILQSYINAITMTGNYAQFDGVRDYLRVADSDDFHFASGNFCVEAIVKLNATGTQRIIGQCNSALTSIGWFFGFGSTNVLVARAYHSGGSYVEIATTPTTYTDITNFHHIALVRNGTSLKIYYDGVATGTAGNIGTNTLDNVAYALGIGCYGEVTSSTLNGNLKGIRITKGDARYTANFTAPTEMTDDSENVVLCARFEESIGATTFNDDCGKTITTYGDVIEGTTGKPIAKKISKKISSYIITTSSLIKDVISTLLLKVNIGGIWKTSNDIKVNIDGVWKIVESIKIKIDDIWKDV